MTLFGVHIDFNKNYSDAELDELEQKLEEGFQRRVRLIVATMLVGLAVICVGLLVVKAIYS